MRNLQTHAQPLHGAVFVQAVLDELKNRGFSPEQIVGNTGINLRSLSADEPSLSFGSLAQLFERAAELTGDDLLGFRHGQSRELKRAGMLAYLAISSPTLLSSLLCLARFQRIFSEAQQVDVSRLEEDGVVAWRYDVPIGTICRQYVEFAAAGIISDLRTLTGRNLYPERIEIRHNRKSGNREVERFFGCRVIFGTDENQIVFKKSDLTLPLLTADDHLYRLLQRLSEAALETKKEVKPQFVVDVERAISDRLASGNATQAEVSKALGLSSRTLARRLAEQDTTFFRVVEGYRQAMAESLLLETEMQLTEIAFLLGYSDLSSFSTAFRRWTGHTPSERRKRQPAPSRPQAAQ